MIGKVIKIYIPQELNNGRRINYLDSNKIGFKISVNNIEMNLILNQNNDNAMIHVNDLVNIEVIKSDGKDNFFISKVNGDEYE